MKPVKGKTSTKAPETETPEKSGFLFLNIDMRIQYALIALLAAGLYFNSIYNEYAFDDGLVILENTYVQKGFEGLADIFTKGELDAFYEKHGMSEQFSGGRYRPLSIAAFAVEQAIFGPGPVMKHVFNVLYYIITCILVLYFFRNYLFLKIPDVALLAAVLFTVHPIHSEVVSNIKSRNELFPMLFTLITMISALKYFEKRKILWIITGCFSLFLALISKEYGVVMAILLPVLFYVKSKTSIPGALLYSLPYLVPVLLYLLIRNSVLPEVKYENLTREPTNNQYIMAAPHEKLPTKIDVLDNYLYQLFLPVTLVSDYSYHQIKFRTFSDWRPWLSLIVHLFLMVAAIVLILKREVAGFLLAFYLAHLFLISNVMVEIGTTYSERLIYMSSLAFCGLVSYYIIRLIMLFSIKNQRAWILSVLISGIVILSGIIVIPRNAIWKNNETLFPHDVLIHKESIILNNNAGKAWLDMAIRPENKQKKEVFLRKAQQYLTISAGIYAKNANAYFNLGSVYMYLQIYDSAFLMYQKSQQFRRNNPEFVSVVKFFRDKGYYHGTKKEFTKAVEFLEYASVLSPKDAELLGNPGGSWFMTGQIEKARETWEAALKIDPSQPEAQKGLSAIGRTP